jgi:hypothetical protein
MSYVVNSQQIFNLQEEYRKHFPEPPPRRPFWVTTYLSTSTESCPQGLFKTLEPELYEKICGLKHLVDPKCLSGDNELNELQVRCIELHVYAPGAGLGDPSHFDGGSVVTVDLMLDDSFEGGEFQTPELVIDTVDVNAISKATSSSSPQQQQQQTTTNENGRQTLLAKEGKREMQRHRFQLGDAVIFPSLKFHQVSTITKGCRKVLVLEFWHGVERHCSHRCHTTEGLCGFKVADVPTFHPPMENSYYD